MVFSFLGRLPTEKLRFFDNLDRPRNPTPTVYDDQLSVTAARRESPALFFGPVDSHTVPSGR